MPFLMGLPSLGEAAPTRPRQRLIVMFSPNGTIPKHYWPDHPGGDFALKPILQPLEPFRDQLLVLKGVHNRVRGFAGGSGVWTMLDLGDGKPPVRAKLLRTALPAHRAASAHRAPSH